MRFGGRFALIFGSGVIGGMVFAMPANTRSHAVLSVSKAASQGWQLDIIQDAFSGDLRCSLRSRDGRMFYTAEAVAFRAGNAGHSLSAWVRIDDGPPARWRDFLPDLARLRVAIGGRDIARPTDGLIWLPSELLEGAKAVSIQVGFGEPARVFHLGGFSERLAEGRDRGCRRGQWVRP